MQNCDTVSQCSNRNKLDRPRNPRHYRRKKSSSRYPVDPTKKRICTIVPPIEQTRADLNRAYDPTLLHTPMAPPEEISVQLKIGSGLSWGLVAEDSSDFEVKPRVKQYGATFKRVVIKHGELDSLKIAPNYTVKLPVIKQEIKTEPLEPPVRIKQGELDREEIEHHESVSECYLSTIKEEPLETVLVDDGDDVEECVIKQEILNVRGIDPICVDDSDDELPRIGEPTLDNYTAMIKHEPLEILDYGDVYPEPEPPLINPTGTQNAAKVYDYAHTCVPQRIYPYRFLMQFVKNTCHRGYRIQAVRLLNGNKNQVTNIYHCDNCNHRSSNLDLIKDHVLTHNLRASKRFPQFYKTTDCKICFQRHFDLGHLRLHLEKEHSETIEKAAKVQKFYCRIECSICKRLFRTYEHLECGEK